MYEYRQVQVQVQEQVQVQMVYAAYKGVAGGHGSGGELGLVGRHVAAARLHSWSHRLRGVGISSTDLGRGTRSHSERVPQWEGYVDKERGSAEWGTTVELICGGINESRKRERERRTAIDAHSCTTAHLRTSRYNTQDTTESKKPIKRYIDPEEQGAQSTLGQEPGPVVLPAP
jgi:hypothetical protein